MKSLLIFVENLLDHKECSVKVSVFLHCNYGEQKSDIADFFYFSVAYFQTLNVHSNLICENSPDLVKVCDVLTILKNQYSVC